MSADGSEGGNGDGRRPEGEEPRARRKGRGTGRRIEEGASPSDVEGTDRRKGRAGVAAPGAEAAPAHGRKDRRRQDRVWGRPDTRSLLTRVPFVLVAAGALAWAITVDDPGRGQEAIAQPATASPALVAASAPGGSRASTWFCAAGTASGSGFAEHTVVVLNLASRPRQATLTVVSGEVITPPAGGAPPSPAAGDQAPVPPPAEHPAVTRQIAVPAGGQLAVRLSDLVNAPLAGALVEVDGGGVAVEHRVRGEHGSDVAPCTTFAATTWHLAWGSTARDARELVVLFNPFPSAAIVDAIFTTPDGRREPVRLQGLPVPAGSVVGVELGSEVTRSDQVAGTFRVRSGRVVIERLQQFDGSLGVEGLTVGAGTPAAADAWVFADGEASALAPTTPEPEDVGSTTEDDPDGEGTAEEAEGDSEASSGNDDEAGSQGAGDDGDQEGDDRLATSERIVVYNPGDERAEVEVRAVPTTDEPGPVISPFVLSVPAGGYEIVDYGEHDRIAAGVPHATVVRATGGQEIVAERVTLDVTDTPAAGSGDEPPPVRRGEITLSSGSRLAAPRWLFPALPGLDDDGTVTFAVVNPVAERAVELVVAPAAGAGVADPVDPVVVPPGGRVAVEVDATTAANMVSALVEADGPVIVERIVRADDGRRVAMGQGIPLALDALLVGPGPDGLVGATYVP